MSKKNSEELLRKDIAIGSAWMVGMRWCIRGIGLISIVILARLLTPEDFGVVAKSMIVVSFIQVFGEAGFKAALIRNREATVGHYNSAWTGQFAVALLLTILTVAFAPVAGVAFGDPRIVPVIWLLAVRVFFYGLENIGTVEFRKFMQFDKEFRLGLYRRLASFSTTLILAFTLGNYWALAIGIVCGEIAFVFFSYMMHPFRPRISFEHVDEVWGYSSWILLGSVGRFFGEKADQIVVAGTAGTASMGVYNVSAEVATMPTAEIITPLSTALFPSYSKLQDQPDELAKAFLNVLSVLCVLIASMSVGLALVAPEFILIVLGDQWLDAIPVMRWLALAAGVWALSNSSFLILGVLGKGRSFAVQNWLRPLLLIPVAIVGYIAFGLEGVAISRLLALMLLVPISFVVICRILPIPKGAILGVCWRPIVAAMLMAVVVESMRASIMQFGASSILVLIVMVGATSFAVALFGLWQLAGRPSGLESAALRYLKRLMPGKAV